MALQARTAQRIVARAASWIGKCYTIIGRKRKFAKSGQFGSRLSPSRRSSGILSTAMPTLVRRLGLWSSIGIVIGITIGGGIFRTPAGIATRVPDPMMMLGVWVHRRPDRALRRAGVCRAVGVDARNRRHVRLPARGLGPAVRVSLRLGAARADPRRGARRHLVGVRRVLPARRSASTRRSIPTGPTISRRAPSPLPPSSTSSASSSARCSPASRRSPSSARWRCSCSLSFAAGRQRRRQRGRTSRRPARRSRPGCSAWR